jgi:hypothetical protein
MKNSDIEIKFEQYREHLKEETTRLATYIHLHKHLYERKKDRLDEMNIAPCFFKTVFRSLFSVIIIWVNNLLDPKAQRGFFNFLSFVENNLEMFSISRLQKRRNYPDSPWMLKREPITSESIESDRRKLRSIQSLSSFKTRRDKFHAHFDKNYAFQKNQISKDAPIKLSDFDKVIKIMKDTLNNYSAYYDGQCYPFKLMNASDIDYILDILHEHKQSIKY